MRLPNLLVEWHKKMKKYAPASHICERFRKFAHGYLFNK